MTQIIVSSGQTVSNSTLSSSDSMVVLSGGTAAETAVLSGGSQTVFSGGVARDTTISVGGMLFVSAGATVSGLDAANLTVQDAGTVFLLAGNQTENMTVAGTDIVSVGAIAFGTRISGDGVEIVAAGGVTSGSVVTLGGQQVVLSAGVASGTAISGITAVQSVSSGGLAVIATVYNAGQQVIGAGGSAGGTIVSSGGEEVVFSGGLASGTVAVAGGKQTVSDGGRALDTLVSGASGLQVVLSGGLASGAVVIDSGKQIVSAGGQALDTLVNSASGLQVVRSGGLASGTRLVSGGALIVSSGGTASGTLVFGGGTLLVSSGGTADGISDYQGASVTLAGGQGTVASSFNGASLGSALVSGSGGTLFVLSGTSTDGTTVVAGGREVVSSGGFASFTAVAAGGEQDVLAGGSVSGTFVSSGGQQVVSSGGIASSTTISGGIATLAGGTAIDLTISQGGYYGVTVLSGGVLSHSTIMANTNANISAGGSAVLVTAIGAGLEVDDHGLATSSVIMSYGHLDVFSGGLALGTVVSAGGALVVNSGGTASGFETAAGGTVVVAGDAFVLSGNFATGVTVSGGALSVLAGGTTTGTRALAAGVETVSVGGVASGTFVSNGGEQDVLSGGNAAGTMLTGGQQIVFAGGNAIGTVIGAAGTLSLAGGTATSAVVGSGGAAFVASGGIAVDLAIGAGGTAYARDGAGFTGTVNDDGALVTTEAGILSITDVISGAGAVVQNGRGTLVLGVPGTGNTFAGGTTISTGTLELATRGAAGTGAIIFAGSGTVLRVDTAILPTNTITGFGAGNAIDLEAVVYNPANTVAVNGDIVTITTPGGARYQLTIDSGISDYVLSQAPTGGSVLTSAVGDVPCYLRGTRIAVERGEVPVEHLKPGYHVRTASGALRPVRWVGTRAYDNRFVRNDEAVMPVRFRAGSLGGGLPRRDLFVSPEHAMFVDDVLIPAKLLLNGQTIVQQTDLPTIEYIHVELDSHDLLLAEGAPAESFIDDNSRGMFQNAAEYRLLYSGASESPARYCAPRLEDGEALDVIQRRLAALACPPTGPGMMRGYLDSADCGTVTGWARNLDASNERVSLRIVVDGAVVGEVVADEERPDLRAAGEGDGRHAFSFIIPGGLSSQMGHVVEVQRSADRQALHNSPMVVEPAAVVLPTSPLSSMPFGGVLDHCDRDRIVGWAWQPGSDAPVALQVLNNGVKLVRILANLHRPDLRPAGIGNGRHGFDITVPGGLSPLTRHVLEFRRESDGAVLPGTPVVIEPAHSFDAAMEGAVERAVAALDPVGDQDRVLSFLVAQTERLLQRRATAASGAAERQALARFRRRWGPAADASADAPAETGRRALVIDARLPAHGRDAGSEAILSHMQALRCLGYDVSVVAADDLTGSDAALSAIGVICLGLPAYASVEDVLRRHAGCFDLVYLHRASVAARYMQLVRQYSPGARVVYSVADLHHVRMARQAEQENRPDLLVASRGMRLTECTAAWSADAVITHSVEEAAELRRAVPGASVFVVPWAVPMSPSQRRRRFNERCGLAFIGHGTHAPNVDAAKWLVEEIMPLVWQVDASIDCLLVGSDLSEGVRALARPGVRVLGHVPDLQTVFNDVRLTAAPLRFGAGIKGKVLTSLAARTPCVLTPVAAEGLPLPSRLRDLVAEDAAGLASLIVRLHGNGALARSAAKVGSDMVRRWCSEAAVTAAMDGVVNGRTELSHRHMAKDRRIGSR